MPYPDALKGNPKVIFFTDFDGTITLDDTNDYMTDNVGLGYDRRRQLNKDCLEGDRSFRSIFQEMMDSISRPFPELTKMVNENINLDPHFVTFHKWAKTAGVPIVILSSGMTEVIRGFLDHHMGDSSDIEIEANECIDREGSSKDKENGWTIRFHDDSDFGHDKSLAIRPYAKHFAERPNEKRPTMLYAGDGVSDLSAARETDLLFAKRGRDLVTYCERENVPFTLFDTWESILKTTQDIYNGKSVKQISKETEQAIHKDDGPK